MKLVVGISVRSLLLAISAVAFFFEISHAESVFTPAVVELVDGFLGEGYPKPRIVMVVVFPDLYNFPNSKEMVELSVDICDEIEEALSSRQVNLRRGDFEDIELIRKVEREESTPEYLKEKFHQKHQTDSIMWIKVKPRECKLILVGRFMGVEDRTYTTRSRSLPLDDLPSQTQPFSEDLKDCRTRERWNWVTLGVAAGAGIVSFDRQRQYKEKVDRLESIHEPSQYRPLERELGRDKQIYYLSLGVTSLALIKYARPWRFVNRLAFRISTTQNPPASNQSVFQFAKIHIVPVLYFNRHGFCLFLKQIQ